MKRTAMNRFYGRKGRSDFPFLGQINHFPHRELAQVYGRIQLRFVADLMRSIRRFFDLMPCRRKVIYTLRGVAIRTARIECCFGADRETLRLASNLPTDLARFFLLESYIYECDRCYLRKFNLSI